MDKTIKMLTVKQGMAITGLSKNTFYKFLQQNRIPNVRVGRRFLIPEGRFHDWLNGVSWPVTPEAK